MNVFKEAFKNLKIDSDIMWMTKYQSIFWKMIGIQKIKLKNNKFCPTSNLYKAYGLILALGVISLSIYGYICYFLPEVPKMSSSLIVTFVITYWCCVLSTCTIIVSSSFQHTGKYIEMLKDINQVDKNLNYPQNNNQKIRLVIMICSTSYMLFKCGKIIESAYSKMLDPVWILNYFGNTVLEFEIIHASIYIGFIAERFHMLNLHLHDDSLRKNDDCLQFRMQPSIIASIWETYLKGKRPKIHLETENGALYKLLMVYDTLTDIVDNFNSVFGFAVS